MILGLSTLPFLWNVWRTLRKGERVGNDPWDAQTLEWWAPSPPPVGNFPDGLPRIRSERPVWDANHPDHTVKQFEADVSAGRRRGRSRRAGAVTDRAP